MTSAPLAGESPHRLTAAQLAPVIYFALLFARSLLHWGVAVYAANQELQIPLVLKLGDPSLFPGDAFVDTLPHYASPLWWPVAQLARVVPLTALLAVLGIASRAFSMWSFGRLAGALAPQSLTARVAAWTLAAFGPEPFIGEGTIMQPYFEHTGVAVACAVLAVAMLIEGRPRAFAVWLGLTALANVLYGVFVLSYCGPLLLERRAEWRKWAAALAAGLVIAAPAVWMTSRATGDHAADMGAWVRALHAYYPHHFFPDAWPRADVIKTLALAGVILVAGVLLRRRAPTTSRRVMFWLAVAGFWVAVAMANAAWIQSPGLFILHPVRGGDLAYVLCIVAICAALAEEVDRGGRARLPAALGMALLPFAFFESGRWSLVVLVALGAVCAWRPARTALQTRVGMVAIALVSSVLWVKSIYGINARFVRLPRADEVAVAAWARASTPRDAVFLVDPTWGAFRGLAERAAFVTWKEGGAMLWQKSFVSYWDARMNALGVDILRPGARAFDASHGAWASLDETHVRELQKRYRIDYWCGANVGAMPIAFATGELRCVSLVAHQMP